MKPGGLTRRKRIIPNSLERRSLSYAVQSEEGPPGREHRSHGNAQRPSLVRVLSAEIPTFGGEPPFDRSFTKHSFTQGVSFVQRLGFPSSVSGSALPSLKQIGSGLFLLVVLLSAINPSARAQQGDSTELDHFRRANTYLQSGEAEKAITILESLYDQSPDNSSFYRKLKDAYESVKRYDDALRLVQDRIDNQSTPQLLSEKARLLYQNEDEEAAIKTWEEAIDLAPDRASTYRIVYQTLVDIRRFQQAIEVLQTARDRLDDDSLFRTELAYLYGLDGQHGQAMQEYVDLLAANPNRVALVRNRLQTFVEQNEGIEASTEVLQTAVENNPLNTAYRELLGWLHMKTDNYTKAYDVYRALDRLQKQRGQALYRFAQQAADADQYEVATTALEAILEKHPDAEVAPSAQRALGHTYRRWAEPDDGSGLSAADSSARYDAARSAYETFLDKYPSHESVPQVRAELGTLQLDVYRNLDAAKATLETVVSSHPNTSAANEAQYDLARLALLRGDLERARLLFSRLADELRSGDLADQARYELALLQFYQGAFDAARSQAQATSANPSADVTNDAIELSVLIQENRGPDSLDTALRQYARAQLAVRQRDYEAAATRLDSLLQQHSRHALADEAQFRLAKIALAQKDTATARQRFRELPRRHPRSPYADRSLFELGTLSEAQGNTDRAIELYDRLLSEYPKSLLASDARTRLRTLRQTRS